MAYFRAKTANIQYFLKFSIIMVKNKQSRDSALSVTGWDVVSERRYKSRCCLAFTGGSMKKLSTKDFVLVSLLLALNIVLSRFLSISAWNFKIGFTFLTIFVCGHLYGPIVTGIFAGLGDLIGSLLFPIGAYFPGFTFTAMFTGVVFGIFLYKNIKTKNIIICSLMYEIVGTLFINTYWIHLIYNTNFLVLFSTRIFQCIVMIIVEILSMKLLANALPRLERTLK